VITAGIILAGLWPFNFWPENKVRWLQDQNGVQFYGQAIIFTLLPAPYSLHPTLYTLHPFSIELWLQPATEESSHIGRIFSFFDDKKSEVFFVGQWRSHLVIEKRMTIISQAERYHKSGLGGCIRKRSKTVFHHNFRI
jgi:hypothetical protein